MMAELQVAEQQVPERVARSRASAALAVHVHGWTPSRFFDGWKGSVDDIAGNLVLQYMHYYMGMPPAVKKRAVDLVLRGTIPFAYSSLDPQETLDAMENDIDALRKYADRFVDVFWKEYWDDFLSKHPRYADRGRN